MIHLFNSRTAKNDIIKYNGEYILDNICSKGTITEELNGEYSFDGVFKIVNSFPKQAYDLLIEDSLLKINDEYGEEYFRIASIDKSMYDIQVYARHITISDILTMWCEDVRPENQGGNGAINWIFDNAKGDNPFLVSSNITDTSTAYYVNKTVYEALFTVDNSFLDRWGGEVYRRGFNIAINSKVGSDRGVSIRSRKNLLGFEASTNINELTTRIYPKGYDGITIEEKYVDSELINNYARIYSREVKFDDIRVNDEYFTEGFETLAAAQEEMKKRCKELYEKNKVDIINASYRVNFVELGKTEEYKNYSILEKTWIGDTVNVIEENLDINIDVRVIKREYDVKKQERINTELSNKDTKQKPPTIGDIITEIEKIPDADNILSQAKDQATAIINAGMKDSYVVVRKNEILIMDTPDINTAVKVWRWNNGGLGYSSNGYYGQYGTAITNDGSIVADFINVGILNADLIKTGILKSFNNKTWINMEDGTFNFADKVKYDGLGLEVNGKFINNNSNGIKAVEISNSSMRFYDWEHNGRDLGVVYSSKLTTHPNCRGLTIAHANDSYTILAYEKSDGTYGSYAILDKNKTNPLYQSAINVLESTVFNEAVNLRNVAYVSNQLRFNTESNYPRMYKDANNNRLVTEVSVTNNGEGYIIYSNSGASLFKIEAGLNYPIQCGASTQINGNFTVTGSKNSLQKTKNYGDRLINAYETAEYYYSDLGFGKINNDECIIYLDDILQECVNLDCQYHVFTQVYKGDIISIDRKKEYFIVKGNEGTEFSWQFAGKRIGYENVRLDTLDIAGYYDSVPNFEEDFKSNTNEEILNKEIEFNLEDILLGGII